MEWYAYAAGFLGGAFLANGVPHFVHGVSGKRFPTPFARPAGVGESSPVLNALWGLANLLAGYVLTVVSGWRPPAWTPTGLMVGLGAASTSVALALHFGRSRGRRGESGEHPPAGRREQ